MFYLPTMPPLYLDILRRLAQWIDVRLYVGNPCREYWLEAIDARRLSYLAATSAADHHEAGNRLLAAWGKQAQAHVDLLLQDDSAAIVDDADFVASADVALLTRLQNAILGMTDLARGAEHHMRRRRPQAIPRLHRAGAGQFWRIHPAAGAAARGACPAEDTGRMAATLLAVIDRFRATAGDEIDD